MTFELRPILKHRTIAQPHKMRVSPVAMRACDFGYTAHFFSVLSYQNYFLHFIPV